jgi:acyl-CoA reductase-like NAD-dependent aldehyde dehydrogenase
MKFPHFTDLVPVKEPEQPTLPKDITAHELLQMVHRGEYKPTAAQMRAATESLPYENPKLSAVAVGHLTGEDFYSRLERALQRSERARLIEGRVIERDERE